MMAIDTVKFTNTISEIYRGRVTYIWWPPRPLHDARVSQFVEMKISEIYLFYQYRRPCVFAEDIFSHYDKHAKTESAYVCYLLTSAQREGYGNR